MVYKRLLQTKIEANLYKGKVIILYGPRRVGKTTLCKQILEKYPQGTYINCELLQNKTALETTNNEQLKKVLGNNTLVVLDEAQTIQNIGLILKILVDTYPEIQIIATGSSSFHLASSLSEPLTGRTRQYLLLPLSLQEIQQTDNALTIDAKLEDMMRFGLYPSVWNQPEEQAQEELQDNVSNYLYKDILSYRQLKRPDLVINLLRALALQVGNEVSYRELAELLNEHHPTIHQYIQLLEQCFIIFRLGSFSRNLRKEIGKGQKIYFYDIGIRNALIRNHNPLTLRSDIGGLWENFCIVERKNNENHRRFVNTYFWQTYDKKEVDYIEEEGGRLAGFEFKWSEKAKWKKPQEFLETYPNSTFNVIHRGNYQSFL